MSFPLPPQLEDSAKVQIPRLDRPREPRTKKPPTPRRGRVSRACTSCRTRKIRCNGKRPQCQNCTESSTPCVYLASRKDRLKTATEHNQDLLLLLQELRSSASPQEKQKIDNILASVSEDVAEAASTLQKSPEKPRDVSDEEEGEGGGEASVTAEVGSNEDLDNMDEDLLRTEQSRATGYMGKNTEAQWFRRLHHEADSAGPASSANAASEGPYGPPGNSTRAHEERVDAMRQRRDKEQVPQMDTSSCSFYLDEEPLAVDFLADPDELPPFPLAERLLKCYMSTVQSSFPFLSQKTFTRQFYHYYTSVSRGAPYRLPQKWQAMLNLVFAIGAAYSHLIETDWRAGEKDHLLYHSRAWTLSMNDPWWLTHPDLAQIQISGLLSFYYMAIGHMNRSWVVIGMTMRFGFSLGLHIRNEDRTATAVKKEILSRIWWAVYSLDRILSAITGRPSVGAEIYCSTTLPLPISTADIDEAIIEAKFGQRPKWASAHSRSGASESRSPSISMAAPDEPANAGTFLTSTIKLGMLSNEVLTRIYSPNLVTKSWKDVQLPIAQLFEELDNWLYSLPKGLNPFEDNGGDYSMQQERNILKIYYYSTKILICRPCLCRLDRRIRSQTESSDKLNHRIAAQCVASAKSIAACLPDDMAVWRKEIYHIFPWWAAVHYIMQSIAVLLLEACYETEGTDILPALKKLVRWLRALRASNGTAKRAYCITVDLLKKMSSRAFNDPRVPQEISEFLAEYPDPEDLSDLSARNSHQWFTGEEFLERYSPPPVQGDPQGDPYVAPPAGAMSNMGVFPGMTEPPLEAFFHEALHSRSPLANVFLTGFDQHNPLPFGSEDMYMEDVDERQPRGQEYT